MANRINPQTMADALSSRPTFTPEAVTALKAFARSKPWQGTIEERRQKFETINAALAVAHGVTAPDLRLVLVDTMEHGNCAYNREHNIIVLIGKLSVVSYLLCFALARGMSQAKAFRWAHACFHRFFPRSAAGCRQVGNMLVRAE